MYLTTLLFAVSRQSFTSGVISDPFKNKQGVSQIGYGHVATKDGRAGVWASSRENPTGADCLARSVATRATILGYW